MLLLMVYSHPGTGTLNVYDGAKVAGGDVGIEMRAGTLNVYDGAEISGGDGEPSSSIQRQRLHLPQRGGSYRSARDR